MSVDVALQVGVEAGCGGEESKANSHELPASLQAVVAEVLSSLTAQLDVELITQTLVAPTTDHHLTKTSKLLSHITPRHWTLHNINDSHIGVKTGVLTLYPS